MMRSPSISVNRCQSNMESQIQTTHTKTRSSVYILVGLTSDQMINVCVEGLGFVID